MEYRITQSDARYIAGLELHILLYTNVLPLALFNRARISKAVTPIYDINGQILFHRITVVKKHCIAFIDIAAYPAFKEPFLRLSYGDWNPQKYIELALNHLRKKEKRFSFDHSRFVAFSYPKIALQFLREDREIAMLHLFSWNRIPMIEAKKPRKLPYFERWSFIDRKPKGDIRKYSDMLKKHFDFWHQMFESEHPFFESYEIIPDLFIELVEPRLEIIEQKQRELNYSERSTDHQPCYEKRGQESDYWCVYASIQMMLDFYRYNHSQEAIKEDIQMQPDIEVTDDNEVPSEMEDLVPGIDGLLSSQRQKIPITIQNKSNNALTAHLSDNPTWDEFVNEIDANRPVISAIVGHARTVAGYNLSVVEGYGSTIQNKLLLVYDPGPVSTGSISLENFNNQEYKYTVTAHL